ncbi:hypothetical protein ATANTOWER_003961 [Ataeniobius toweri]|uniref:Uncharacterized protein n=1 Tax=Ataeniobius toweri TaxID=208326 RepID=A0ABU7AVU7_9TELE|nr:hypothetical protein [Ataeniobius toweri]
MEELWSPVVAVQEPWRLAKKAHEKPTENITRRLAEIGTTVEWALKLKGSVERALGFGGRVEKWRCRPDPPEKEWRRPGHGTHGLSLRDWRETLLVLAFLVQR